MVKFTKLCSEVFTASPIDVVVLKCRNMEIGEIVRYLPHQKDEISAPFQTVATASVFV